MPLRDNPVRSAERSRCRTRIGSLHDELYSSAEPSEHRVSASTVEEHLAHVESMLAALSDRPAESAGIADAVGRVAHADVVSPVDLPLFRNSQMDGYAVRAADVDAIPATLHVTGTIAAGPCGNASVAPGTAMKIMTGAPIPDGADTVVPVEHTTCHGDRVTVTASRTPGGYIREQGSDITAGTVLVRAGQLLQPRHIAVLAAVGLSHTDVRSRPRVAVITTGAELVDAGSELRPGQIYDSNGVTLAAHLRANGADVVGVHRSSDDPDEFHRILHEATAAAELVITSGGVSMGDFEVVKDVLTPLGGRFGAVRMQPGGPQGTATIDGVPVLDFPGNPVSTVVSFLVFARNAIREAAGLAAVHPVRMPLTHRIESIAGKRQFLRGAIADGAVSLVAGPGSHLVAAMAWADVLVDVAAETTALEAGDEVEVLAL